MSDTIEFVNNPKFTVPGNGDEVLEAKNEYLLINMTDILVTSVSTGGGTPGTVDELALFGVSDTQGAVGDFIDIISMLPAPPPPPPTDDGSADLF